MLAAAAVLLACQTPAPTPAPPPPSRTETAAPAPAPATTTPAPPAPSSSEAPPAPTGNAQRLVATALELLEQGNDEQATVELQRALQIEPGHRLAQSLMRQITADPVATLGRESFPYRVQPGESLSRIAQRFLGDLHLFYILARYNDIKVPRQLAGGQLIRVPGKAPPPSATAPAASAPVVRPPAGPPPPSGADVARAEREKAERDRAQRISAATRSARAAFARQDLTAAIQQWDLVLELDPGNATAKLERQRAVELKERLGKVR